MADHFVIDGSNLATEGRTEPSLAQLKEAVAAFHAEHPGAVATLVVDASFEHRIDPSERARSRRPRRPARSCRPGRRGRSR